MKDTLINPASPLCTFVQPQFHCELLIAHQIPYEHLDDARSQQALAHHLLNGLCAQNSGIDCCAISGSLSVVDLALTLSDLVVDCPFDSLKVLCNSLGFQLTFETTRVELLQLLAARRRTLTEHGGYSIETCFHGFEKLSEAYLLSLAAAHGMSPVGSLDHIKSMITDHVLKGQCMTPTRTQRCGENSAPQQSPGYRSRSGAGEAVEANTSGMGGFVRHKNCCSYQSRDPYQPIGFHSDEYISEGYLKYIAGICLLTKFNRIFYIR
jgi:hypothetical protein